MGKTCRVVVCGMKGVGKTAILEQAIYGNLTKDTFLQSTIEDIYVANIETDRGTKERVRFYDTCGGDIGSKPNVQLADGYMLVYNPTKAETLEWIMEAKKEIDKTKEKKEVIIVPVANHFSPTPDVSVVSRASNWAAREKLRTFDVSALKRGSLYDCFVHLASRLNPQPNKSAFPQLRKPRD
ncbi:hypothetical protein AAG570_013464 [Ranatra chinensis]|uniref:NF-kappa-B inhibitor-interacting Ras-like protein n=1 Tax=Ranatra chinensis TaxID=642074 RepID=A0ABD0YC83_9HEMI